MPAAASARGMAAELIGYAVAWAGFALASLPLAEMQGAAGRLAALHRRLELGQRGAVPGADRADGAGRLRPAGLRSRRGWGWRRWAMRCGSNGSWRSRRCGWRAARRCCSCVLDLLLGIFIGGFVGRLTGAARVTTQSGSSRVAHEGEAQPLRPARSGRPRLRSRPPAAARGHRPRRACRRRPASACRPCCAPGGAGSCAPRR